MSRPRDPLSFDDNIHYRCWAKHKVDLERIAQAKGLDLQDMLRGRDVQFIKQQKENGTIK